VVATCAAADVFGRDDLTDPGGMFADFNKRTGIKEKFHQ
jgi:hypothetical protein